MVRTYDLLRSPTSDIGDAVVILTGVTELPVMQHVDEPGDGTWYYWSRTDDDGAKSDPTGPAVAVVGDGPEGDPANLLSEEGWDDGILASTSTEYSSEQSNPAVAGGHGWKNQWLESATGATAETVTDLLRNGRSVEASKFVMQPNNVRYQIDTWRSWFPDATGSVDLYYGWSMYLGDDWDLSRVAANDWWINPMAFRMDGDNGSMNFSGDKTDDNEDGQGGSAYPDGLPHIVLRRNTIKNQQGFYTDGLGLDKIDCGPIVKNAWMDFVVRVAWSTTATGALRECWRDGVHMGAKTSLNAVATNRHRFRLGMYQNSSTGQVRTSWFDNCRIGLTYASVDPSAVS